MRAIIADTSCLIIYDKIQLLDVLRKTFPTIVVTKQVAEEFGKVPDWIIIQEIADGKHFSQLTEVLGKGEASSIVLALEREDSLLIIDEKKGRKIAQALNVEIIGSLGVLIKAKEKGIFASIRDILDLIDQTDFRVSNQVRDELLRVAGEYMDSGQP